MKFPQIQIQPRKALFILLGLSIAFSLLLSLVTSLYLYNIVGLKWQYNGKPPGVGTDVPFERYLSLCNRPSSLTEETCPVFQQRFAIMIMSYIIALAQLISSVVLCIYPRKEEKRRKWGPQIYQFLQGFFALLIVIILILLVHPAGASSMKLYTRESTTISGALVTVLILELIFSMAVVIFIFLFPRLHHWRHSHQKQTAGHEKDPSFSDNDPESIPGSAPSNHDPDSDSDSLPPQPAKTH